MLVNSKLLIIPFATPKVKDSVGTLEDLYLAPGQHTDFILQQREGVRSVIVRNLAGAGVGGHFFHEIPILTTPLVGGGVLEIEVFLDVVGSELNTGLLVGDRTLRADTHGVPSISNNLVNISGIILTGVVGLKDSGSHLVLNQALGTFRLRHLSGGVIKDYINDIHITAVNLRHRHRGRVRATFRRIANGDDGIRVTVFRQLEEVVQLVLVEQQTLRFKGLLLELALKLLRTQQLCLLYTSPRPRDA